MDIFFNQTLKDIDLKSGDLFLTDPIEATRQHLIANLRGFKSEWFLDLDSGVPYYQDILIKNPNVRIVESIFKEAIINTIGVIELTSFELTFDTATRTLILDFSVNTFDGEVNFEGLVVG